MLRDPGKFVEAEPLLAAPGDEPAVGGHQSIAALLSFQHHQRGAVPHHHAGCSRRLAKRFGLPLQVGIDRRRVLQRPKDDRCGRRLGRGMGAVEADDAGRREQLGDGAGEGRGDHRLRPIMPSQPIEGLVSELGRRQARAERVERGSDTLAERLAVHGGERCVGWPRRQ